MLLVWLALDTSKMFLLVRDWQVPAIEYQDFGAALGADSFLRTSWCLIRSVIVSQEGFQITLHMLNSQQKWTRTEELVRAEDGWDGACWPEMHIQANDSARGG